MAVALLGGLTLGFAEPEPPSAANGQEGAARPVVRVGVEIAPPFVLQTDDGRWAGISIALWERIADDLGVEYVLYEDGEVDLVDLVEAGRVDIGIGALVATAQAEDRVDFTHPYLTAGLAIATRRQAEPASEVWRALVLFFSPKVLQATFTILAVVAFVGFGIWLLERRRRPSERSIVSLEDGFWWSVVTMTTVGYGDKTPDTRIGRMVAAGWMLLSLAMLSMFTAVLASAFTAAELKKVRGPEDLRYVEVGTVRASTASGYLQRHAIDYRPYPFLLHTLRALRRGEVDAVVFEAATLRYMIDDHHWRDISVEGQGLEPLLYCFALPDGSNLREPVNQAILRLAPSWRQEVGLRMLLEPSERSPSP